MKRNVGQFPTCDSCGREIRGKAVKVPTKTTTQMFHPDAHACASAPERKERSERAKKGN